MGEVKMKVLWKAATVGPGLVASTLVVSLVLGPNLPAPVQPFAFYGGLLVMGLLCFGAGEALAIRVLFGARPMTASERTTMAPVISELCRLGLGPPITVFYVARRGGAPASIAHGRRSVVMSRELVHGVWTGQLQRRDAVAVLAHAALVARTGFCRQDPAIAFWSTPWRLARAVAVPMHGVGAFAWKIRFVVFGVAIYQCITSAPPVVGPIAAAVLTMILVTTYAAPHCARKWDQHVTRTADHELVLRALGAAMAEFLRRYPQTPDVVERIQLLESSCPQPPRLRLVGG